jgi:uncharacterized protein YjbI with pentapeptide repeats
MRRLAMFSTTIMFCMLWTVPQSHSDQLKTGIMKTAPSPNQISGTPTPTPQVPGVKPAPGVPTPVPTKQGITAPLGQKATIAVKSPAQGTRHPADKPLPIIWDRSVIGTAATVNILLMDKPGGTAKATIRAGAPNTGSFTSWIAPQQYTSAGNSWAIRIETADRKASGQSGVFSFQPVAVVPSTSKAIVPSTTKAIVPSLMPGQSESAQAASTPAPSAIQANQVLLLEELKLGQRKDFSRASLAGLSLKNLNLEQAIFQGADFSGADLSGANLTNCDFTGANLTGANLTEATCINVSFRNARLVKAILKHTRLYAADFTGAALNEAFLKFYVPEGSSYLIKISNSNLQGAVFDKCGFNFHEFKNVNMKNVRINGGEFYKTDFSESQLDGIVISGNPSFKDSKIHIKYINLFKGKTDSFPYIKWVN